MDISPYLAIPIATIAINQIIKLLRVKSYKDIKFANLLNLSNQPSWLIAISWSLLPVNIFVDGVSSPWFATNLVVAAIAFEIERRAKTTLVNRLISAAIGLSSSVILSFSYWRDDVDWLFERPNENESKYYLYIFGGILVFAEFLFMRTRRSRMRKLPTSRRLQRVYRYTLTLPAAFGLVVALMQNQTRTTFMADRLWTVVAFIWITASSIWAVNAVYRTAKQRLSEEASHFDKEKKHHKKKKRKKSKRGK